MAIGRKFSYATTEAPKDPLLGTLQNIEQVGFQKRAEDRAVAEAKAKAKKEEDDALAVDLAKIKSETTKFPTKNALIIDAMDKLRNGVSQKAKERASGKISSTDYNIYKNNAESQISLIDQAAKRINAQSTDYAKQLAEGKFAKGFEENALNFGGAYDKNNIFLELNPDGTFTSYLYDDTDPENPKILDKNGLAEFGQNAFVPVYNYDLDKDKQEFITAYPKVLNERFVGDTKVGTKGIAPEIQKAIDLKVEATIANKDALAIKAREITGKANPKVEDPEIIEQVRQNLQKEYKGLYATDKMVDEATGRGNLDIARKNAEKEEEESTPVIGSGTITSQEGVIEGTNVKVPKGAKTFAIANAERKLGTGKIEKLKEVRRRPDGSLIFVVQETYDGENVQKKELSEVGKAKEAFNKKNAQAIKDKKVEEKVIYDEDYETVTTTSKRPTTIAYDTAGGNAEDAENFAIMLKNPETGEYFSGINEARYYFNKKASSITSAGKKETPAERASRIARGE